MHELQESIELKSSQSSVGTQAKRGVNKDRSRTNAPSRVSIHFAPAPWCRSALITFLEASPCRLETPRLALKPSIRIPHILREPTSEVLSSRLIMCIQGLDIFSRLEIGMIVASLLQPLE